MSDTPAPALFDRYLAVLGVPRHRPTLDALAELTAAHLAHVPLENVSKLYFRHDPSMRGLSDLASFLDGAERYRFGGTCYATNYHFNQLLNHLGYDAAFCGADMSAPDVHVVSVVKTGGRRFLVDVGYGAPLVEPLCLDDAEDREVVWGSSRYVVRSRGTHGRPELELYRDGSLRHGYVVNPAPRRIEEFAPVIAGSFADGATFMQALLVARFAPQGSAMLRNLTLTTVQGGDCHVAVLARSELPETIEREFGMPREIVHQALDGIALNREP